MVVRAFIVVVECFCSAQSGTLSAERQEAGEFQAKYNHHSFYSVF